MNQLVGFTDGETIASYAYNASGLRYEKTVDGETVHHVWDGNQQIIADVVESQFYEANCYIRGTNLAATYHYQNGAKSDYTYYVQNAHGDVVNLTDADGAVTKTYHYDAFGVEQNIVDSDENAFRYCGEYFDSETGTIYLRARYYDPTTGRFTQRDSYTGKNGEPLSLNLYIYCANNPVFYIDPSGHSFGILLDGTMFQINSLHDANMFYEKRNEQLANLPLLDYDTDWEIPDKWVKHNEEMLTGLKPEMQLLAKEFLLKANKNSVGLIVTDAFRTRAEQEDASAASGQYPSNATSRHEEGIAFDVHIWDESFEEFHYQPIRYSVGNWCTCDHNSPEMRDAYDDLEYFLPRGLYWGGNYRTLYDPVEIYMKRDNEK